MLTLLNRAEVRFWIVDAEAQQILEAAPASAEAAAASDHEVGLLPTDSFILCLADSSWESLCVAMLCQLEFCWQQHLPLAYEITYKMTYIVRW